MFDQFEKYAPWALVCLVCIIFGAVVALLMRGAL